MHTTATFVCMFTNLCEFSQQIIFTTKRHKFALKFCFFDNKCIFFKVWICDNLKVFYLAWFHRLTEAKLKVKNNCETANNNRKVSKTRLTMMSDLVRRPSDQCSPKTSPRGNRSPVVPRQDSSGTLKTTISLGKTPVIVHSGPFYLMKELPRKFVLFSFVSTILN